MDRTIPAWGLFRLFRALGEREVTGTLTLSFARGTVRFMFKQGFATECSTDIAALSFQSFLVQSGMVTDPARASQLQTVEQLVDARVIRPEDNKRFYNSYVRSVVDRVLAEKVDNWSFAPSAASGQVSAAEAVDVCAELFTVVQRHKDLATMRSVVARLGIHAAVSDSIRPECMIHAKAHFRGSPLVAELGRGMCPPLTSALLDDERSLRILFAFTVAGGLVARDAGPSQQHGQTGGHGGVGARSGARADVQPGTEPSLESHAEGHQRGPQSRPAQQQAVSGNAGQPSVPQGGATPGNASFESRPEWAVKTWPGFSAPDVPADVTPRPDMMRRDTPDSGVPGRIGPTAAPFRPSSDRQEKPSLPVSESRPDPFYTAQPEAHPDPFYPGRDGSRPDSSHAGRDESRPDSFHAGRADARPDPSYAGRADARPESSYAGRDESRPDSFYAGRADARPELAWPEFVEVMTPRRSPDETMAVGLDSAGPAYPDSSTVETLARRPAVETSPRPLTYETQARKTTGESPVRTMTGEMNVTRGPAGPAAPDPRRLTGEIPVVAFDTVPSRSVTGESRQMSDMPAWGAGPGFDEMASRDLTETAQEPSVMEYAKADPLSVADRIPEELSYASPEPDAPGAVTHDVELDMALQKDLARAARLNHYELLEISPDARLSAVRMAVFRTRRKHSRARYEGAVTARSMAGLDSLLSRINNVGEVLSDLRTRVAYNRSQGLSTPGLESMLAGMFQAREMWRRGMELLDQRNPADALEQFELAESRDGDEPDYLCAQGRALLAMAADEESFGRIESLIDTAFGFDRDLIEAHMLAALYASRRNDPETARIHVRKVLLLDPENREAKSFKARPKAVANGSQVSFRKKSDSLLDKVMKLVRR